MKQLGRLEQTWKKKKNQMLLQCSDALMWCFFMDRFIHGYIAKVS